jgi:hypothetical protein
MAILELFVALLVTLLRPAHAVAQSKTVICCECGSVLTRLCRVSMA